MAASIVITLGIGAPADMASFILTGLTAGGDIPFGAMILGAAGRSLQEHFNRPTQVQGVANDGLSGAHSAQLKGVRVKNL